MSATEKARLVEAITAWTHERYGKGARVRSVRAIDDDVGDKGFGYANVIRIELEGAPVESVVLHIARRGGFGHEDLADRAHDAFLPWQTFNTFPEHVRALDVGYVDTSGILESAAAAHDFFLVTEYAKGTPYFHDLERIATSGAFGLEDEARVVRLAELLAKAHAEKRDDREAWLRRLRDLAGHHECVAGLVDSYDGKVADGIPDVATLRRIEHRVLDHRHRLKPYAHRLARVHGDFHPWNLLFDGVGAERKVVVLDRSRGAYGEPADDLTALSINYLFFALRHGSRAVAPLRALHRRFFDTWLAVTKDPEVLAVAQPYLVFRALVVASPVWYPDLPDGMRARLFALIDTVLDMETLDLDVLETFFER